ncbi:MAG: hypothetical protein ACYCXW_19960 [Solirubrobacteraceae bacterium]
MIWIVLAVVIVVVAVAAAVWSRSPAVRARPGARGGTDTTRVATGSASPGIESLPAVPPPMRGAAESRILFPFFAHTISAPALAAAIRLARIEQSTLVAVYLARVSLDLPLDAPIPRQAEQAIPLQEAIEQEAARVGVSVDARIARGRTCRHALEQALEQERFDRVVIAAGAEGMPGFNPDDVAWLLEHARGEIIVIRPDQGAGTVGADGARGVAGRRAQPLPLSAATSH